MAKTFAQRAKAIQDKYKKSENDPVAMKDMERELTALMEEQEAYRESMGMNKQGNSKQYVYGGTWDGDPPNKNKLGDPLNLNYPGDLISKTIGSLTDNSNDIYKSDNPLNDKYITTQKVINQNENAYGVTPWYLKNQNNVLFNQPNGKSLNNIPSAYNTFDYITDKLNISTPRLYDRQSSNNLLENQQNINALRDIYGTGNNHFWDFTMDGTGNKTNLVANNPPVNTNTNVNTLDNTSNGTYTVRQPVKNTTTNTGGNDGTEFKNDIPVDLSTRYNNNPTVNSDNVNKPELNPYLTPSNTTAKGKEYNPLYNKAYMQGLVGLIPGIVGNAFMWSKAKPNYANLETPTLNLVDRSQERENLMRQSEANRDMNLSNLRNVGMTSGEVLSGLGAVNNPVNRNLNEGLSQSYSNEYNTNAELKNRHSSEVAGIHNAEQEINARERDAVMAQKIAAMNGLLGSATNYGMGIIQGQSDLDKVAALAPPDYTMVNDPETGLPYKMYSGSDSANTVRKDLPWYYKFTGRTGKRRNPVTNENISSDINTSGQSINNNVDLSNLGGLQQYTNPYNNFVETPNNTIQNNITPEQKLTPEQLERLMEMQMERRGYREYGGKSHGGWINKVGKNKIRK